MIRKLSLQMILLFSATCITSSAISQITATDVSTSLWQGMSEEYDYFDCSFQPVSSTITAIITCQSYYKKLEEQNPRDFSFMFLAELQPNGTVNHHAMISAKTPDGNAWVQMLAFGQKNSLLAMNDGENQDLGALDTTKLFNHEHQIELPVLWGYQSLQDIAPSGQMFFVHGAVSTLDGGFILFMQGFTERTDILYQTGLLVLKLDENGKKLWAFPYKISADLTKEQSEQAAILDVGYTITSNQSIVLATVVDGNKFGTNLVCLNQAGQQVQNQFFENYFWHTPFKGFRGDLVYINDLYDAEKDRPYLTASIVDENCQKKPDYPISFPDHGYENSYFEAKNTLILPNGNLGLIYVQNIVPEEDASEQPLPSMYLAELDHSYRIVGDHPLIIGDDPTRAYLKYFSEGEGADPLNVTLTPVSSDGSFLMLIYNFAPGVEEGSGHNATLPRLYQVRLPH